MAKPDLEKVKDQSIQARARGEGATLSLLLWAVRGAELISPWWSKQRDADLRRFWKSVDHLAGAVYTIQSRLITIPFQVLPRDKTVKAHVRQAEEFTDMLINQSEFGEGWGTFYSKFVEDLVTQDGGSMGEIIGEGRPDGPIIGMPNGIAHLDSWRCLGRDSRILLDDGTTKSILEIVREKYPGPVITLDGYGNVKSRKITNWHETPLGDRYWLRMVLEHAKAHYGKEEGLWLTNDHEILTPSGWIQVEKLSIGDKVITVHPAPSEQQSAVLVGTLLGDGHLTPKHGKSQWSRIGLTQGSKQKEWLELKRWSFSGFKWTPVRIGKNKYDSVFYQTECWKTPSLGKWRDNWYPEGRKVVHRESVEKYFGPLMLATWFCDDGDTQKRKWGGPSARISTLGFPKEDVVWLANFLTDQGIETLARTHSKGIDGEDQYYLYVTVEGSKVLFQMIAPYVPDCLRYKLPEGSPEYNKELWEEIEPAVRFADIIAKLYEGNNGEQVTTFCIDVEDDHNFVASGTVVHNCTRTGDPEFPIIYQDTDGKRYKMHYTRVAFSSQMPSPSATMNGVGFCAVSRCINIAQNILDILVYKQEKLGSRPQRSIMVTSGGLDPDVVRSAFIQAESQMQAQQLRRYSKTVVIGHEDMPDAKLDLIDLASLPDGFDERESIILGMAAIALAFGMDAREPVSYTHLTLPTTPYV